MSKKRMLTLLSTAAISAVAALSVPVTATVAAPSAETKSAASKKFTNNLYIVRMAEAPVVAYDGTIKGLQATRPKKGQKIDPNSPAVVNYMSFLESRHNAALASVGGAKKVYSYGFVYNGFAAELTAEQAAKLAGTRGVLGVIKDEAYELNTSSTPDFLGLTGPDGVWENTAEGRGRNHRHRRRRRLARAPELLRSHRHATATTTRTASSDTSRFPAGTAAASRARTSPPATATRN